MNNRETQLYDSYYKELCLTIDKMFSLLLVFEWTLAMVLAIFLSPYTWDGNVSTIHPHVYMAFFLGGALTLYPLFYLNKFKGAVENKFIVCVSQMLYSTLLIHITNGRIETHFHIFGSMAFLAFYRDARVLGLATVITAVDHFIRGLFYPESIYGVVEASEWRALEHALWVVFENIFLFIAVKGGVQVIKEAAHKESELERAVTNIEAIVETRTAELKKSQDLVVEQQVSLANSARLSSLGEMAAGIAHEINNPLAIISGTTRLLRKKKEKGTIDHDVIERSLTDIEQTVERISKIIVGLRNISRDATAEESTLVLVKDIFQDVLAICSEKMKNHSILLQIEDPEQLILESILCRRVQISQVLLNMITNSYDAINEDKQEGWIRIALSKRDHHFILKVADSGKGIPVQLKEKIFQPFFTTKDIGKGTGLGLSLSKSILEKHGGTLSLDTESPNTQFIISLPDAA